jgi:hypothetical protein
MVTTLIQKHLFKGTREYEIAGEQLNVRVKTPFKNEERFSVTLAVLNPEPVINKSDLEFVSRVNGEALISLMLAKPNTRAFNDFVSTLKQKALAEYDAFSGLRPTDGAKGLAANVYEEPPEFDETGDAVARVKQDVDVEKVDTAIRMLQTYLDPAQTEPLIAALESLRAAPENDANLDKVVLVFSELGACQGAVLTYAPYIAVLVSDDPSGD